MRRSVVVCTKDRPALLAGAIASIAAAASAGDDVIVVVAGDDGARDDGWPAAVRVVVADRPGKSHQLNLGIAAAEGEVLVLTDDDCVVEPGWIDAMAAPFGDGEVGAAFGPVEGLSTVPGAPPRAVPPGPAPPCTWEYAHGASMALRRRAIDAIGGFDERLGPGAPVHGEEHDVVLRLAEHGWRTVIADAPAVRHVAWRSAAEDQANRMVYERGTGAFLGAAMRRAPRRWWRLCALRLRYQLTLLWRGRGLGTMHGGRALVAFIGGFVHGLHLPPHA